MNILRKKNMVNIIFTNTGKKNFIERLNKSFAGKS